MSSTSSGRFADISAEPELYLRTAATNSRPTKTFAMIALLGVAVFFLLRAIYWQSVAEEPFSDMADYYHLAERVASDFDFAHDKFWISYKPPTLPLLGGAFFWLMHSSDLFYWRPFMALIMFASLVWFALEFAKALGPSKKSYLAVALFWTVAVSKASIFWSYKFSTETTAEMFTYMCAAAALFAVRRGDGRSGALLGFITVAAILNRPQSLPLMIFLPIFLFVCLPRKNIRRSLTAFFLALLVTWSPWVIRNFRHYGAFVPLSTQGPYSFLWELGEVCLVEPDGHIRTTRLELRNTAVEKFENDYQASYYAGRFVKRWLLRHYDRYPKLILDRFQNTVSSREVHLTRISREELFASSWLNKLLVDKNQHLVYLGLLGLLFYPLFYGRAFAALFIVAVMPWLMGLLFLSTARILEPTLPLIIFGNLLFFDILASRFRALFSR